MTGYLQRLAERAMGRSRPARAGSAAPFAPAPALAGEAVAVETLVTAGAFASVGMPRRHGDAPPSAGQGRAAAPTGPAAPGRTPPTAPERRPGAQPSHDAGLPAASSRPVAALAGRVPRGASAAEPGSSANTQAWAPGPVPQLLPPAAATPPPAQAGGGERALGHGPPVVEETTEVHVHIGRIEVTAVHEPAPAKPAGSRRPAPMALDDYLARRHGKRP